jgi:DNA-binding NtrC family response regulator
MAARPPPQASGTPPADGLRPLGQAVEQFEQEYIRRALDRAGGHRGKAAALLGISRKSLWERLRDADRARDEDG